MRCLFLIICVITTVLTQAQTTDSLLINGQVFCVFQTDDGGLNGSYESFYSNGQKRADGRFENNCRKGNWSVWDSTGRLRMQRYYRDLFYYDRIVPPIPGDAVIQLFEQEKPYYLEWDTNHCIRYFELEEHMVMWAKRTWSVLYPETNVSLFEGRRLQNALLNAMYEGNIQAYSADNDEFFTPLAPNALDTNGIQFIGYKIKEDWFFDNQRFVMEARIIGLCPVVVHKVTGDTTDLCWFYFPEIRGTLSQLDLEFDEGPSNITSMDDLFFYQYFSRSFYKTSNVYDRRVMTNPNPDDIFYSRSMHLGLIEYEHVIWISLTP